MRKPQKGEIYWWTSGPMYVVVIETKGITARFHFLNDSENGEEGSEFHLIDDVVDEFVSDIFVGPV